MSRNYEMHVLVTDFDRTKENDIDEAIQNIWGMSEGWDEDDGRAHRWFGEGSLGGGVSEAEFSRRIRNAVWTANRGFCEIEVQCVYLDDPPTEYYTFDEDDYEKWKKTNT